MMDLDRKYGIWSGRVWGLIVNLVANALALYGLVGFLRDGTHLLPLIECPEDPGAVHSDGETL